jgi:S-adenosylmethionine/arginine decarboxylase-like enzyme
MAERGIDALDITRLLKNAELMCPAYRRNGEWRYRVHERPGNASPERKGVAVVVVVVSEDHVACHTVYRGGR